MTAPGSSMRFSIVHGVTARVRSPRLRRQHRLHRPAVCLPGMLLAVAAGFGHTALCQDAAPDLTAIGIEAVMNMEVTSVSKRPERLMDAAAAVQVITSDDIRRSGATTLPDLLRLVPGLQFAGVYWDVQDVLLNDIDRIEVIRGPGATLWGANAVNGVVNIITKSAAATQGAYASVRGGNQDRVLATGRFGGKLGRGAAYRAYARF